MNTPISPRNIKRFKMNKNINTMDSKVDNNKSDKNIPKKLKSSRRATMSLDVFVDDYQNIEQHSTNNIKIIKNEIHQTDLNLKNKAEQPFEKSDLWPDFDWSKSDIKVNKRYKSSPESVSANVHKKNINNNYNL